MSVKIVDFPHANIYQGIKMSKDPYNHIRREVPPSGGPIKSKTEYDRNKLKNELEEIDDIICPFCGQIMKIVEYEYYVCKKCKYWAEVAQW